MKNECLVGHLSKEKVGRCAKTIFYERVTVELFIVSHWESYKSRRWKRNEVPMQAAF